MTSDVMVLVRKARADWLRAQCEVVYVRVLMAAQRYADALRREDKYRPDQPRVPAGNPDGGQWTDAGGGGEASVDLAQGGWPRRQCQSWRIHIRGDARASHAPVERDECRKRLRFHACGTSIRRGVRARVAQGQGNLSRRQLTNTNSPGALKRDAGWSRGAKRRARQA